MPGIELNWPNKDRVLYEIPQRGSQHKPRYYGDEGTPPWPDHRPLLPVSAHGEPDADPNRLIQGDNLVGLQALLDEGMGGKFQCIYIDPPFNTGTAFEHYDDGYEHTIWLGLMRDRLKLLHKLLADTGLVFVQIDYREGARLKLLMDEVFGPACFKNEIIVRRGTKNVQSQFENIDALSTGHDYIILYAKSLETRLPKLQAFASKDDPGKWDTFWRGTDRPTMRYELFGTTPASGQWRWSEERGNQAKQNYEVFLSERADGMTLDDYYGLQVQETGTKLDFVRMGPDGTVQYYVAPRNYRILSDVWMDVRTSGGVTTFSHEKHEELLERIIHWATHPGDWVLDSFAGSGTTAAVAYQLGRKWVTLEQGDHARTHCLPRLDKVRQGTAPYKGAAGGGFVFQQVGPPLVEPDPDLGVPRLNPVYVNGQYQKAVCQLTGFTHQSNEPILHGRAGADGGRYCHVAERGLLVTPEYLVSLRETLAALTPAGGQDAPTCVVYATRAASGLEGGSGGDSVEVVRIPAGFAKKGGRDSAGRQ